MKKSVAQKAVRNLVLAAMAEGWDGPRLKKEIGDQWEKELRKELSRRSKGWNRVIGAKR